MAVCFFVRQISYKSLYKLTRVKGVHIVHLFADSHKFYRQLIFARKRERHTDVIGKEDMLPYVLNLS